MPTVHKVLYGDVQITSLQVLEIIRRAIEESKSFKVNNDSLGGDPKPNVRKDCIVQWRDTDGGPLIADEVGEGNFFDFRSRIQMIKYGGVELLEKPDVYARLHKACRDNIQVVLNNDNLGGDPRPSEKKDIWITRLGLNGFPSEVHLQEGDKFPSEGYDEFSRQRLSEERDDLQRQDMWERMKAEREQQMLLLIQKNKEQAEAYHAREMAEMNERKKREEIQAKVEAENKRRREEQERNDERRRLFPHLPDIFFQTER